MITFYKKIGFVQLNRDLSIFIRNLKNETSIMDIYIDNFLLASDKIDILKMLKKSLSKKYGIKGLGEVKTIIGQQID